MICKTELYWLEEKRVALRPSPWHRTIFNKETLPARDIYPESSGIC